jgi:protocatechuate 3,4-dioxygenase beta subunit
MTRRKAIALAAAAPLPLMVSCSDSDDAPPTAAATATATNEPGNGGSSTAAAVTPTGTTAATATLPPTPQCTDEDDEPTIAQTEGPYFTPNSPERTSLLESGMSGTRLLLTGQVLSTSCAPVAGALVDFWQCDDAGEYDNAGYRFRGHQFTNANGEYMLETVVPGLYPGRTRHIHVKVQAPNEPVLTTQLYFPGEERNASDRIYNSILEIEYADGADGKLGAFTFVLDA